MPRGATLRRMLALAAALALAGAWLAARETPPHDAGSDLYTHLSVARHLERGEGFLCDMAYPLSLTFPFAARVPQPLVHRPPGYPLLMTLPVAAGGDDPARTEALAGRLSLLLLALTALCGAAHALGRGRGDVLLPWLAVMLVNPLLHMTVGWAQVEIPTALLLLWLWIRLKDAAASPAGRSSVRAAALSGFLAGAIALLRGDLFWLPWLWMIWPGRLRDRRGLTVAAACWAVLLAPWWIRNAVLCGDPLFTLQAYAEHLKQTPAWPGYSIYASLSPESFWHTLGHDPGLILRKALAGLRYYATRLDAWLPAVLWGCGALAAVLRFRRSRRLDDPLPVLGASLAAMILAYAAFSYTLRYLAVLLPVLTLEMWLAVARETDVRLTGPRGRAARLAVLAAVTVASIWILPARMPGWERARDAAARSAARLPAALERLEQAPEGPIFTDSAALLWYGKRAGVWLPGPETHERAIRALLPEMTRAPTVRQGPDDDGSGEGR